MYIKRQLNNGGITCMACLNPRMLQRIERHVMTSAEHAGSAIHWLTGQFRTPLQELMGTQRMPRRGKLHHGHARHRAQVVRP